MRTTRVLLFVTLSIALAPTRPGSAQLMPIAQPDAAYVTT